MLLFARPQPLQHLTPVVGENDKEHRRDAPYRQTRRGFLGHRPELIGRRHECPVREDGRRQCSPDSPRRPRNQPGQEQRRKIGRKRIVWFRGKGMHLGPRSQGPRRRRRYPPPARKAAPSRRTTARPRRQDLGLFPLKVLRCAMPTAAPKVQSVTSITEECGTTKPRRHSAEAMILGARKPFCQAATSLAASVGCPPSYAQRDHARVAVASLADKLLRGGSGSSGTTFIGRPQTGRGPLGSGFSQIGCRERTRAFMNLTTKFRVSCDGRQTIEPKREHHA